MNNSCAVIIALSYIQKYQFQNVDFPEEVNEKKDFMENCYHLVTLSASTIQRSTWMT